MNYADITHASNGRLKATGNLASATWRAADAATRSAIGGSGSGRDGLLVIPVKDDAPAGTYTVNITASANRNLKGSVSFEVPAAREPAPRPGQPGQPAQPAAVSVAVASTSDLTAGGRAEFTYTLADSAGNPLPRQRPPGDLVGGGTPPPPPSLTRPAMWIRRARATAPSALTSPTTPPPANIASLWPRRLPTMRPAVRCHSPSGAARRPTPWRGRTRCRPAATPSIR